MRTKVVVLLVLLGLPLAWLAIDPARTCVFPHPEADEALLDPAVWGTFLDGSGEHVSGPGRMPGPHGESPAFVTDVAHMLGPEERRRLREGDFTAAVCMQGLHDPRNDWSRLQVSGIRTTLTRLGIRLIAVTDAEFEIERQVADYRNVIALRPDLILTIPLDSTACAPVLHAAAAQGIRLVFMDSVPTGMRAPGDYQSLVMADSYHNGRIAAELLARHLHGTGTVALLHWQNRMFTCDERSRAAREFFAGCPGIRIVAEPAFSGVYDVKPIVHRLLDEHPDLGGLWVVWDTPALEAAEVISDRRAPTRIATVDLSAPTADALAAGSPLLGVGAQHPYHQGVAEALAGAVALAGRTPPPFIVIPGHPVTRENVGDALRCVLAGQDRMAHVNGVVLP